jgi:hypothetical protein
MIALNKMADAVKRRMNSPERVFWDIKKVKEVRL